MPDAPPRPVTGQPPVPCPSCHALVRWATTEHGRRQPVDADPNPAGNLACYTDAAGRLRSRVLTRERPELDHLEWRAMPHAATCTAPRPRPRPRTRAAVPYRNRPNGWWTR